MSKPTQKQLSIHSPESPTGPRQGSLRSFIDDLILAREAQAVRRARPYLALFGRSGEASGSSGPRKLHA